MGGIPPGVVHGQAHQTGIQVGEGCAVPIGSEGIPKSGSIRDRPVTEDFVMTPPGHQIEITCQYYRGSLFDMLGIDGISLEGHDLITMPLSG